jgi:hypothetical protein
MSITKLNNLSVSALTALPSGVGGKVLQVITATDLTQRSTTSTSFVTASNTLSVSITPSSASNKVFIIVNTEAYASGIVAVYTIYRGATNIGNGSSGMTENRLDWSTVSMSYLDSPSTTSATTYQVYWKVGSGTGYLNNGNTASITAFEIAG